MHAQSLWVPCSVLNTPHPGTVTRLVWLFLSYPPWGDPAPLSDLRLHHLTGLAPQAVALARARLAQAPLAPCHGKPHRSCAPIPLALLTDGELSPGARLLYGQLQGVPDFAGQAGSFTYAALAELTGRCRDTLRKAVAELVAAGWLSTTQRNRKSALGFTLRDPVALHLRARISSIRRRYRSARFRGELLLREFLNARVAATEYRDDAAPEFLLNPFTKELMELDRYYPQAAVAFELNGTQHYHQTDLATREETVKQVGRDAMKAFLCKARGIELVIVHPEDLSLRAIDQKIPKRLPRQDLAGMEPLVAALEALAGEYRERAEEEQARISHRQG